MAIFALTMIAGPSWDPARQRREQDGWDEHAAFMDALVDERWVILGGPIGDGERVLLAVEAPHESDVAARLAEDPWASSGVLRIGVIEPWTVWLDSRRLPIGRSTRMPATDQVPLPPPAREGEKGR